MFRVARVSHQVRSRGWWVTGVWLYSLLVTDERLRTSTEDPRANHRRTCPPGRYKYLHSVPRDDHVDTRGDLSTHLSRGDATVPIVHPSYCILSDFPPPPPHHRTLDKTTLGPREGSPTTHPRIMASRAVKGSAQGNNVSHPLVPPILTTTDSHPRWPRSAYAKRWVGRDCQERRCE